MSSLAGRLAAGKEGAYFFQESKRAVTRLAARLDQSPTKPPAPAPADGEAIADVLPEVLRHSLPSKLFHEDPFASSTSYAASKWGLPWKKSNAQGYFNPDALNPLRAYISLPQATFGPKRWQIPEANSSVTASTANDLRWETHPRINPEKLKAAAEGLSQIGKAFAVSTAVVFGGTSLIFGMAVSRLDVQNIEDIRVKGRNTIEPKFEAYKKQLVPFRDWAESLSKKWHIERTEDIKKKRMISELKKILSQRSSN